MRNYEQNVTPPKAGHQTTSGRLWESMAAVWRRKTTVIAVFAATAIVVHLILRFAIRTSPGAYEIPLLSALALGGTPLVYELAVENSLQKVDEFMHLSRRMRSIALQSAIGGMALSLGGMVFAASGHLSPVTGAIGQEIIDVLAVLNALRAAFPPKVISDLHVG